MDRRALVVDDEAAIASMIGRYLARLGYEVVRAEELEEAQALLLHFEFSVIIADLKLTSTHGAEGFELISFIRKHCPFAHTILLTGHASYAVRVEAERRGAEAVLGKPFALPELARVVEALVAGDAS